ncbi:separin isoform X1 [Neofelis nebulosa]|uniref:separin isoform X1 n=1 Tax=Neofelis nebulosa TaxID=61452 RepID=UPI002729E8F5|nr:separin isoform X1 [Neofelis nebulosa]XP_058598611.1 separin isoform X1 [Neofelis nebulosa]XP_058598612.1 separin isoform X1 [Neofelis nebulosa]XP_058598613.1 separin isoform X1 [Neofelis nebulosa]
MRSFKGINFGNLLSSVKEAEELLPDLKEFLSKLPAGSSSCRSDAERRQACDAILRACNQQLTAKLACPRHLESLLELAELAYNGYLMSTPQRPPLYLERILFIFLRNIATQGIPEATLRFAKPLHDCLVHCSRQASPQDYDAVARGSFSLLWKAAETLEERRAALSTRLKALSFLVLLEDESTPCEVPHFASPTACRVVAAHQLFDATGHSLNEADADFLDDLLSRHVIKVLVGEGGGSPGPLSPQRALCLLELTLERCRRLCWSGHHAKATRVVEKTHDYLRNTSLAPSLQLCQLGVELLQAGEGGSQALAELLIKASAVLNSSVEAPSPPLRALCDSCQFFLSGLERGIKRRYGLDAVLGLFAFLGGYCSLIRQLQDGVCGDSSKQQQSLVQMHFQGLHLYTVVVYDFVQSCQVADLADLAQLVESCKSTVVWMLEALQSLSGQELTDYLGMTASYTSNLAYSFYSHKLYAEACAISEPLCQHLGLVKPDTYPEVPPEKLHRCFRLHGESLKKLGKQAQGCEMVTLWLTALQPCGPQHMAEPVTFWVRIKMDAARAGDKELQLRTLRDSLSGWDPETLVFLLREELQAYKAVRADTGQERFNVICDLLELSPEETPAGAWARATHLVELAQVLCYHDFAQQTNCSALDAIQEALQLLESVRPETQAKDRLLDDKAQALLWFYICTLETKMQEGIERDRRAQAPNNLEEFEVNDLNYEDKLQEDRFLYSNIAFNLAADAAQSKCLDQALALWKEVLTKAQAPAVRCLQQTAASLQTLAALYQLAAKPLQALEVLLLVRIVSQRLEDHAKAAGSSCHASQLLLMLGCPSYAQLYLEEADSSLKLLDHNTDTYLLLLLTCNLLRSQLYCVHQKVTEGASLLLSVLRDPALQRSSKAWYLLRVQALQVVASYLSLSSHSLSASLREQLCAQGWQTPEIALVDSHKLLRSIILLLLGSDVLSIQKAAVETPFLDYGENLVQKWQVLTEVLSCSEKLVSRLGHLGCVSEAKAFCLDALKLTTKLQLPHQCALFLVLKAELELARTDIDLCESDLQQVLFLLESCTEFGGLAQHLDSVKKVHLQKGKQQTRVHRPPELPEEEPFLRGPALELVATVAKEPGPVAPSTNSSPVLKAKPQPSPGFLTHLPTCDCLLCASPVLSAVCLRWALVTAGVRLALGHQAQGLDLLQVVLKGCPAATERLTQALQTTLNHKAPPSPVPSLLDEILAQAYTQLALEGLSRPSHKSLGKVLESGLKFVAARVPHLEPWRASLLLIRALAKLAGLNCCTTQLFASSWGWQPPSVKPSPGSEPSKPRSQKLSGRGRQRAASSTQPLHNTSLKSLEGGGLPCTPKPPGQVRPAGTRVPFTVFEEVLPTKSKPEVPKAPRVQQRVQTRLKVNFSDDSDLEDPVSIEARPAEGPKRRGTASRGRGRGQARKNPSLKTVGVAASSSAPGLPGLGGRSRRAKKVTSGHCEELGSEIMRTIPEEEMTENQMEMSFEILRGSDGEDSASGGKAPAPGPDTAIGECEVLRRDSSKEELPVPCPDKERDKGLGPRLRLSSAPVAIGLSTLDSICDLLTIAFRGVSHCPPSGLYAYLCRLLALCLGHRDPYATACLVTESVSITCRHQLLTHLHRQLSKAQKHRGSLEMADQVQRLSLQDRPGDVPLARIQHLFSFRASGSGQFPEPEKESFQERLALIPSGVTVCVLALATLQPGTVGNTLLLTRLEKDNPPVTVQIPTAQSKLPLSSALKEFDTIQKEQKENSSCTDKREWWTGRLELDHRMEALIISLEKHVLGCWRGLLLPSSEDPGPAQEASRLQKLLQECGWEYPDAALLKTMLSGASTLTPQDIETLAYGLCPARPERAQELLSEAVRRLQGQTVPSNRHLVLVLDKDLQKLPWESIPSLRALPVTRLPSFHFLLSYSIIRESGASAVLSQGVDPRNTFYVLNPHNNLSSTEEQFRANFSSEAGWKGVVGEVPSPEQVQAALTEHDLYIYAGHGAGARFLDGQAVLRLGCRAVALLFGCSSAALAVHGNLEGAGIVLKYIMAGCPLFLGNLWDVTDRDIDRYTEALLQGWLGAGPGAPLLYYVNQARQAPRLKYLIGAAPVAYGLPVSLR